MGTFNLVKTDLMRALREKSLYIIMIVNVAILLLMTAVFRGMKDLLTGVGAGSNVDINAAANDGLYQIILLFAFGIGTLGLYLVLSLSLFNGRDFKFNTIRNKIIAGNSRVKIFISTVITNIILMLIYYVVTFLFLILFTLMIIGNPPSLGESLLSLLLALLPFLAVTLMTTFFTMWLKSTSRSIIFLVLIIVVLPSVLTMLVALGGGTAMSDFFQWLQDVSILSLPARIFGNINNLSGLGLLAPLTTELVTTTVVSSLIHIAVFFIGGLFIFKYSDIK